VMHLDLAQAKTVLQRAGFTKYRILYNAYTPVKADVGKVLGQTQAGLPWAISDEILLNIGTYKAN
jgi:hypothetical protein